MKTRIFALGFAALVALPVAACSSADTDPTTSQSEEGAEVEDLGGKADGVSKPTGTYQLSKPGTVGSQDLSLLVLKTDKTFHSEVAVMCVTTPCNPIAIEGTYKLTKSTTSAKRFIRLDDGETVTRYEYKLTEGGVLKLRKVGDTPWFEMTKAEQAWCSLPDDCLIQNIPQPKCPGEWQCNQSQCEFSECSFTNDCESAGGACVGLAPGNCEDGIVGDAEEFSCGGMLGVMCCLPIPEPPMCDHAGTADEGWYWPDGTKICTADCAGAEVACGAIGSKSEGWRADFGQGCGGGALVAWDNCG